MYSTPAPDSGAPTLWNELGGPRPSRAGLRREGGGHRQRDLRHEGRLGTVPRATRASTTRATSFPRTGSTRWATTGSTNKKGHRRPHLLPGPGRPAATPATTRRSPGPQGSPHGTHTSRHGGPWQRQHPRRPAGYAGHHLGGGRRTPWLMNYRVFLPEPQHRGFPDGPMPTWRSSSRQSTTPVARRRRRPSATRGAPPTRTRSPGPDPMVQGPAESAGRGGAWSWCSPNGNCRPGHATTISPANSPRVHRASGRDHQGHDDLERPRRPSPDRLPSRSH